MKARMFGVFALLALAVPIQVQADDVAIAKQLSKELKQAKEEGNLQQFRINVKVEDGTVWMKGHVASDEHRDLALNHARRIPGVELVVNDIEVAPVAQASAYEPTEFDTSESEGAGVNYAPTRGVNSPQIAHRPGPARPVSYATVVGDSMGYGGGAMAYGGVNPVPVGGGGGYPGGMVYEQAQMPKYAWPSYAAHPNYAAIQYPKQYSPMAWPYIGPFYPYPQVPLGWRKVCLEWDDGWWQLDFKHK